MVRGYGIAGTPFCSNFTSQCYSPGIPLDAVPLFLDILPWSYFYQKTGRNSTHEALTFLEMVLSG